MELNISELLVGILEGGVSEERAISFLSGEQVFLSLQRQGIKVLRLDINTRDKRVLRDIIYKSKINLAFIALHGEFGEDGGIQSILEEMSIPYTGSGPRASYLAMNKIASKEIFLREGIPTPKFFVFPFSNNKFLDQGVLKNLPYPVVIKPYFSGSSLGVSLVRRECDLEEAFKTVFSLGDKAILEEYIEGREFTVGILDEIPLEVVEIIPKRSYFDFSTKYSNNKAEFIAPARIDKDLYQRIQRYALRAHQVLGCRHFSRVDIILSKDSIPFILEVNSIPGLTSHSLLPLSAKCSGLDFDGLIRKMISLAIADKHISEERLFR